MVCQFGIGTAKGPYNGLFDSLQKAYAAIACANRRTVTTVMSSSCPNAFAASAI